MRGHLKPIATLRKALRSVDIDSKEEQAAAFERSDVTAVPAAGVIAEAMVALVLAKAAREKFGGDSLGEMRRNYEGYVDQLRRVLSRPGLTQAKFRVTTSGVMCRGQFTPEVVTLNSQAMLRMPYRY
ncbi:MAG: chorismate synthase [Pyrinomonadaceae bacterium]